MSSPAASKTSNNFLIFAPLQKNRYLLPCANHLPPTIILIEPLAQVNLKLSFEPKKRG